MVLVVCMLGRNREQGLSAVRMAFVHVLYWLVVAGRKEILVARLGGNS